jgi:hypothetical protein
MCPKKTKIKLMLLKPEPSKPGALCSRLELYPGGNTPRRRRSVSSWRDSVGKWQSMNYVAGKASSREPTMPGPRTSWRLGRSGSHEIPSGDATRQEIDDLKRDNSELKQLVADLSLDVYRLKKTAIPQLDRSSDSA